MLTLERVELDACPWERFEAAADRVVFQTRAWLDFVAETQRAQPVVAALRDGTSTVGWFTGLVTRRYGLRILGSPLPGWTTQYMGFTLDDGVPLREAFAALPSFAFAQLGAAHLELRYRRLTDPGELAGLGYESGRVLTFRIDLSRPEDELLLGMTSACRRNIRAAEKRGVMVEEADPDGFAEDYYAQLEDVFAKQQLVPTYGVDRVRALVRHLHPTGKLLLLRARTPDGESAATGIFPGGHGAMYFWGGASWRAHQQLRPNEPLMWHAMRWWKAHGALEFDTGGGGDYKRKYGDVEELYVPFVRLTRYRALRAGRSVVRDAHRLRQVALGRLRARSG